MLRDRGVTSLLRKDERLAGKQELLPAAPPYGECHAEALQGHHSHRDRCFVTAPVPPFLPTPPMPRY